MIPIPLVLSISADLPSDSLQVWLGPSVEARPFKDFAVARSRDIASGAKEPYRTWLLGLMQNQTNHLRDWAATRLVEAGAEPLKGVVSPNGLFLDACTDAFNRSVIWGNGDREHQEMAKENPPKEWLSLGAIAEIPPIAPCWAKWRTQLREVKKPSITLGFYALFSPRLVVEDEAWVFAALAAACEKPNANPWQSLAFLLATDWLMLYGQDTHWNAFEEACTPKSWHQAIQSLEKQARKLLLYWNATNLERQGVRLAVPSYPFHPDTFVAPKLHRTTFLQPEYPTKASALRFSTDTKVDVTLDAQGHVIGLGLYPGYALGIFGPDALAWIRHWTFDGATLDGQPVPAHFAARIRFLRKP